jgi:hypothetical protein
MKQLKKAGRVGERLRPLHCTECKREEEEKSTNIINIVRILPWTRVIVKMRTVYSRVDKFSVISCQNVSIVVVGSGSDQLLTDGV